LALLTVFQEGKLQEYHDFVKANGGDAAVTKYGLDPTTCVKQIRILSLCTLAAEHEEIPYAVVSKTLQLDSTASSDSANASKVVEQWVIAAVSSGLLSAKMDQLQEKVMVERCVVRKFDMEQWKVLQARLKTWKQNVGGILDAYKQSQASLVSPAAGN
jgi:translation initiation factor 3 subunit M